MSATKHEQLLIKNPLKHPYQQTLSASLSDSHLCVHIVPVISYVRVNWLPVVLYMHATLHAALFKAIEQDSTEEVKQQLKISGASLLNM